MKYLTTVALIVAGMLMSCSAKKEASSDQKTPVPASQASSFFVADSSVQLSDSGVSIAGIVFHPPVTWKDLGPSGMRKAQYAFGPIADEADSATMAVYYFGQNQGGTVRANIDRWVGQMMPADSTSSLAPASESQKTVAGLAAHVVEVSGTYKAGSMMGPAVLKSNYRMTALVLEAPGGNVFFKLTGPDKTAQKMTTAFASMIEAVQKDSQSR